METKLSFGNRCSGTTRTKVPEVLAHAALQFIQANHASRRGLIQAFAGLRGYLRQGGKSSYKNSMNFTVEFEQEPDGRWIAEVAEIPGAMVYGSTKEEASAKVQALALRVLAERLAIKKHPWNW